MITAPSQRTSPYQTHSAKHRLSSYGHYGGDDNKNRYDDDDGEYNHYDDQIFFDDERGDEIFIFRAKPLPALGQPGATFDRGRNFKIPFSQI